MCIFLKMVMLILTNTNHFLIPVPEPIQKWSWFDLSKILGCTGSFWPFQHILKNLCFGPVIIYTKSKNFFLLKILVLTTSLIVQPLSQLASSELWVVKVWTYYFFSTTHNSPRSKLCNKWWSYHFPYCESF